MLFLIILREITKKNVFSIREMSDSNSKASNYVNLKNSGKVYLRVPFVRTYLLDFTHFPAKIEFASTLAFKRSRFSKQIQIENFSKGKNLRNGGRQFSHH